MLDRTSILSSVAALILLTGAFFVFTHRDLVAQVTGPEIMAQNTVAAASAGAMTSSTNAAIAITPVATSTPTPLDHASSSAPISKIVKKTTSVAKISAPAPSSAATGTPQISRIQNPYPFAQLDQATLNYATRDALVNILCIPNSGNGEGISGSGVVIDPRGVILTNAHVAQYILLSESNAIDLSCVIRTGSPAQAQWKVEVLYIPPIWVDEHASDLISNLRPTGTGEHDYALLMIDGSINGSSTSSPFPYLPVDSRETIGFPDDQVLVASYPAEFSRVLAQNSFYSASSFTAIKQLMTFGTGSIDVYSLGGIIEAQNGSSGGAVVNAWGRLIGVVVTTSAGATTGDRDLHALTVNYIDRDITAQSGHNLADILENDVVAEAKNFNTNVAPILIQKFLSVIPRQ